MPDYSKTKIYKLYSRYFPEDIYWGSTTRSLSQRLANHVYDFERWKKGRFNYCSSYKIINYGNYVIELVENFPCTNKDEQQQRERYWIDNNPHVNIVRLRTPQEQQQEYYQANKETILEKHKEYYENNKEKISIKKKEWAKENKDKMDQYYKDYREQNKEHIKEIQHQKYLRNKQDRDAKSKQNYQDNKEAIKAQKREVIICECGAQTCRGHISRHRKTKAHMKWVEDQL